MLPSSPRLARATDFQDLPRWLWLWLPLAMYAYTYFCGFTLDHEAYRRFCVGETTLIEIATVLVLVVAVIAGILVIRDLLALKDRLLLAWIVLGTLACLYFGGEEASWGQMYLRWSTPESWQALNDQDETNLHNFTGYGYLLDQLPRALLTLGVFVGGIAIPLYLKLRGQRLDPQRRWYWIWPTIITLPVAMIAVFFARVDRNISSLVGYDWPYYNMRTGELKEFALGYFLMLYQLSFRLRLRQLLADASHS